MSKQEKAINDYISKSGAFAQPILIHLRELVHKSCPDVEEKMKWSFPHFDYKNEMMCSMAAFKRHAVFGFWKASLMKDPILLANAQSEVAMGHLGRITSMEDLPPDKKIIAWIKEAMQLNEMGVKLSSKIKKGVIKELEIPGYFTNALSKNNKSSQTFESFSSSQKKEYIEWITTAKTEGTRIKRMSTAIEWLAEGKSFHWKYKSK